MSRTLFVTLTLLCLASWQPLASGQLEQDVRREIHLCIGDAPVNALARARLNEWGDEALPVVEALVHESYAPQSILLSMALAAIETPAAADLLIDLLELDAGSASLTGLLQLTQRGKLDDYLGSHQEFREYVIGRLEQPGGPLFKQLPLRLVRHFKWPEAVPALQALVDDPAIINPQARSVYETLTGRVPELPTQPERFPAQHLEAGLVEVIGRIKTVDAGMTSFAFAELAGDQVLLVADYDEIGTRTLVYNKDLRVIGSLPFDANYEDYLLLRHPVSGEQRVIVVGAESLDELLSVDEDGPTSLVAYGTEGQELWRYVCPFGELERIVPVYKQGASIGLAFLCPGDSSIVALDLDGELMWRATGLPEVRSLSTHPDVGDRIAYLDASSSKGSVGFLDASGKPVPITKRPSPLRALLDDMGFGGSGAYWDEVLLLPAEGGPRTLQWGSDLDTDAGLLRLVDADGRQLWTVTLPGWVEHLGLLEGAGGPRRFVVLTEEGGLYVLAEDGTLLHREQIRGPVADEPDEFLAMLSVFQSGPFGGQQAFGLQLMDSTRLTIYRVGRPSETDAEGMPTEKTDAESGH